MSLRLFDFGFLVVLVMLISKRTTNNGSTGSSKATNDFTSRQMVLRFLGFNLYNIERYRNMSKTELTHFRTRYNAISEKFHFF